MYRLLGAIMTVLVVLAGVWLAGAVVTEDAQAAMALTGAWFAVSGVAAFALGRRRRRLAVPVLGAWLLTSAFVGGYLLLTSTLDDVVSEDVVTAAPQRGGEERRSDDADQKEPTAIEETDARPVLLAAVRFRDGAHPTNGRASLIETPNGERVLTLTRFAPDPGPDLRVYLVPGDGTDVTGAVDLGRLKGNKGNQQYEVPSDAPNGAVVIWCRAFTVAFGAAELA